jgi:hypothetical protein
MGTDPCPGAIGDIRFFDHQRPTAVLSDVDEWDGPLKASSRTGLLMYLGEMASRDGWIDSVASSVKVLFDLEPNITQSGPLFAFPPVIYSSAEQANKDDGCSPNFCVCTVGGWSYLLLPPAMQCARAARIVYSDLLNDPVVYRTGRIWLAPRVEIDSLVRGLSYGVSKQVQTGDADCGYQYGINQRGGRVSQFALSGMGDQKALRDIYELVLKSSEAEVCLLAREDETSFYDCEGFRGYISSSSELVHDADERWSVDISIEEY